MSISINGPVGLPPASFDYEDLKTGLATALAGSEDGRDERVRLALLAAAGGPALPSPTQMTVAFLGSSTPDKYFNTFVGTANSRVSRSTDGVTFTANGTTGQGAATFGNLMASALNRDMRLLRLAKSGSTLVEWEADGSVVRAAAVAAIKASKADAAVIIVGFNDAWLNKSVVSQAAHTAMYRSLISKLRAEIGRNIRIFIGTSQRNEDDQTVIQQLAWVRAAEMTVAGDANNSLYAHSYDLPRLADNVHMAEGAYVTHATRGTKALLAWINRTPYDPADAGPTPPLTYTPGASNGAARINHMAPTNSGVSGYNNWSIPGDVSGTPSANAGLSMALVDTAGNPTGWTATIQQPFVGSGAATGASTGNDSGAAPDQVLASNWFVGDAASPNARRDPATIRLSGLNPARLYDLRFLGSRSGTTARETTYTVEGANSKSASHVNNGNTATTTTLTDLQPNADGTLLITIKAAGTVVYGYLNETRVTQK